MLMAMALVLYFAHIPFIFLIKKGVHCAIHTPYLSHTPLSLFLSLSLTHTHINIHILLPPSLSPSLVPPVSLVFAEVVVYILVLF